MTHPIRDNFDLPHWESFSTEGFIERLSQFHLEGKMLADKIAEIDFPSFDDIILPFEKLDKERMLLIRVLGHMKTVSLEKYPEIAELDEQGSALESAYRSDLGFHVGLYNAYLSVSRNDSFEKLSDEQRYIVTQQIKSFELNGISLNEKDQKSLRELREGIATLQSLFETNIVRATDAWSLHEKNEQLLEGMPESVILACKSNAKAKNLDGLLIPLKSNIANDFLESVEDSGLREKYWSALVTRASEMGPTGGQYDNGPIMVELLSLRNKAAKLLHFSSHAALSIESKMTGAIGVEGVSTFIERLAVASHRKSKEDRATLEKFAESELGISPMLAWDSAYVSRHYKKKYYTVDDEELRDYFPMTEVFNGLSDLIFKLFGCTFREAPRSVWHESVKFFEVLDARGEVFGGFYADLFSRVGKQEGAWMDDITSRLDHDGITQLPVAFLCASFRSQSGVEPYLTHDDVITIFHEIGHIFHHLLSKTKYIESSMLHVEWDAVELPSQFLEHWCWDKPTVLGMTRHKITGERLPEELFDALYRTKDYMSGLFYGGQLGLALFDWNIHKNTPLSYEEILEAFKAAMLVTTVSPVHSNSRRPSTFSHAFGGGYDAGYFSYSWANSLVADVVAAFDEVGRDKMGNVSGRYKDEILAYAASRPMIESFRAFRGRNPDPKYLIPYIGLSE